MRLLHQLVEHTARIQPDTVAIVDGGAKVGYAELDRAATQLGRFLLDSGAGGGGRVGIFAPRSIDAIVAMLGTLKAGGVYVPLDPRTPTKRLAAMLSVCEPTCVLTTDNLAPTASSATLDLSSRPKIRSFSDIDLAAFPDEPIDASPNGHNDAYILFTSGSTGTPKAVPIGHHNVLPLVEWALEQFEISSSDRLSGHFPLHFDPSVFDIFTSLAAGAELHLVPESVNLLPNKVAEFIRERQLTQWFSVPTVLTMLVARDVVSQGDFPDLERLFWIGESIPPATLRSLMRKLPHVQFTNMYGPTETTVISTFHTVSEPVDDIPIGRPLPGEHAAVLDDDLGLAANGTVGQLHLAGVGLSRGYLNDPHETSRTFIDPPAELEDLGRLYRTGDLAVRDQDGLLRFRGRNDRQVKLRGYRIELDDIASTLSTCPEIAAVAVVAIDEGAMNTLEVCAAYTTTAGHPVDVTTLTTFVRKNLPDYMAPERWMHIAELPLMSSGKVDNRHIEQLFQTNGEQYGR